MRYIISGRGYASYHATDFLKQKIVGGRGSWQKFVVNRFSKWLFCSHTFATRKKNRDGAEREVERIKTRVAESEKDTSRRTHSTFSIHHSTAKINLNLKAIHSNGIFKCNINQNSVITVIVMESANEICTFCFCFFLANRIFRVDSII